MKNIKKMIAAIMTAIMLITVIPFISTDFASNFSGHAKAFEFDDFSVGDIIEFGSYPQSKVTDNKMLSALDAISKTWISYRYYVGKSSEYASESWCNGKMVPSDYMKYCDITYGGKKYRAVTFSSYRRKDTGETGSTSFLPQSDNGYKTGNVYYFKYEPLTWRILDPEDGLVLCENIIDSQAFNNYLLYYDNNNGTSEDDYYGDSLKSYYASNWEKCSLRVWLNNDFYNSAFTSEEKSQIGLSYNNNKSLNTKTAKYDSADTYDKLFPLSYDEAENTKYGFQATDIKDTLRKKDPSDYAQCQNCYKHTSGKSFWWLRSAHIDGMALGVSYWGDTRCLLNCCETYIGVCPAMRLIQNVEPEEPEDFSDDTLNYHINENEAEVTGVVSSDITELTIPEAIKGYPVTSIASNAFLDCKNLKTVRIPSCVTQIETHFPGLSSYDPYMTVYYEGTIDDWARATGFDDNITEGSLDTLVYPLKCLYVNGTEPVYFDYFVEKDEYKIPIASTNLYLESMNEDYFDTLPETIVIPSKIGNNDVGGVGIFGDSLVSRNVKSFVIEDGVKYIFQNAFSGCKNLETLYIPSSIEVIDVNVFSQNDDIFIKDIYYDGTYEQWNNITIYEDNDDLLYANIHFNSSTIGGKCGENATWSFNKESGSIVINGTGKVDNYSGFEDCEWRYLKNSITYVEVGDGITEIGANSFNGCPAIKEVYLGKNVKNVAENAFANCGSLSIVCSTSGSLSFGNAFSKNGSNLKFIVPSGSSTQESLTNAGFDYSAYNFDREKDGKKVLSFDGRTVLYEKLDYNYISKIVESNPDIYYLYFDKLVFDGIYPDTINLIEDGNVAEGEQYFAFEEVYICAKVDGETVSINNLADVLRDGKTNGIFLFEQKGEETQQTFFEKVEDFFVYFYTSALSSISRAINSIVKIFRKR